MSGRQAAARLRAGLQAIWPGLLLALTVALAALFVSSQHGGPTLLYALLLGIAFHFLASDARVAPGVEFAARHVLRIGVALLGARIALDSVIGLGLAPVLTVLAAVFATIAFGLAAAWALGLSRTQGILSGGATAICGASAALAIASVLPQHRNAQRDTLFVVIGVTTLSTVAMVVYPLGIRWLGIDDTTAGVILGATIHDVAQVVGAGFMISDTAGESATITKLLRVTMLVPVVLLISILSVRAVAQAAVAQAAVAGPKPGGGAFLQAVKAGLPGFLIVFVVLMLANSFHLIPQTLSEGAAQLARWCLVVAIAALGVKTSFKDLAELGWRPVALLVAQTLFLAALVLAIVLALF